MDSRSCIGNSAGVAAAKRSPEDEPVSVAIDTRAVHGVVQLSLEKMWRSHAAEARLDLERALAASPEDPHLLSCYGLCVAGLGEVDRGIGLCERALRFHPDDMRLRLNLGRAYRLAGDNRAAHRSFLRAWRQNKRDPAPAAELARMGVRRPPLLRFLPRQHWCNRTLGRLRAQLWRALGERPIR
jgi:Flp pilus assembly protein TadD